MNNLETRQNKQKVSLAFIGIAGLIQLGQMFHAMPVQLNQPDLLHQGLEDVAGAFTCFVAYYTIKYGHLPFTRR